MRLWDRAAVINQAAPWPPRQDVLHTFSFFFCNGDSLSHYASHLKSVLKPLHMPLGVLNDITRLLHGARKLTSLTCRRSKRGATAEQTRRLAKIVPQEFERPDMANSWIVARGFCFQYQAGRYRCKALVTTRRLISARLL